MSTVQQPGIKWTRVWLLFTFVTNQAGFDTGITIANISLDPFGTKPEQGGAKLFFYGSNAPNPIHTGAIEPGTTWTNIASRFAPGFQGYVIAECNFSPARGLAVLINPSTAWNISAPYVAEVLRVDPAPQQAQEIAT